MDHSFFLQQHHQSFNQKNHRKFKHPLSKKHTITLKQFNFLEEKKLSCTWGVSLIWWYPTTNGFSLQKMIILGARFWVFFPTI